MEALRKMLNLFAATSPINYAKCGQLYLQLMTERLFHGFTSNFKIKDFIVLGEPINFGLIYGQIRLLTIMRPIKSLGGLTRERGMNKSTLDIWISTLYHCAATKHSMRKITKTVHHTSEQQVELGRSRRAKEYQDLQKLYSWLQQFNCYDLLKNNY